VRSTGRTSCFTSAIAGDDTLTGDTVTDPDELRAQFDAVAASALAEEHDEAVLGESSVAAPIFDTRGAAVGAIAVVLPTTDWPVDEGVRDALREAARNISRELGSPATGTQPGGTGQRSAWRQADTNRSVFLWFSFRIC
jgi:DNA-binding IclR family transcriptional regulator